VLAFLLIHGSLAAPAGRRTENVILVTDDGLRWQELIVGAVRPQGGR
jgi:hypothetical protein